MNFFPFSFTWENSVLKWNFFWQVTSCPAGATPPEFCGGVLFSLAGESGLFSSDKSKTLTAFGTTALQDVAAAFGGHSCAESASAGSYESGRLIGSFHFFLPFPSCTGGLLFFQTKSIFCKMREPNILFLLFFSSAGVFFLEILSFLELHFPFKFFFFRLFFSFSGRKRGVGKRESGGERSPGSSFFLYLRA